MKKLLTIILFILFFYGCNFSSTPSSVVERYLDGYINLSEDVVMNIETSIAGEDLSKQNKEMYKMVLTREYQNLKYEIKDESINGDKSKVLVKLTVFDLYKSDDDAYNYMNTHMEEFMENNEFDNELYNTYRIGEMLKTNDTVDYEIIFNLSKINGEWILENPSKEIIEKIHGMYNYKNN